jgi:hypothetical protein
MLTADDERPGFDVPGRYRSGDFSWEARLGAGRAWHQGAGQREIRRQNLQGLLWTVVALAIVAGPFLGGGRSV